MIEKILNDFLSEEGFDCFAVYEEECDSYYDYRCKIITLGGLANLRADYYFINYVKTLGLKREYSIDTLTFFHELGHHITLPLFSRQELMSNRIIINSINFRRNGDEEYTEMDYLDYFKVPIETAATQWAINYINNNPKVVDNFDNKLNKAMFAYSEIMRK